MGAQVQSVADWGGCGAGGFHGSARHEHRQCGVTLHGRQSRRQQQRQHLGAHLLSGFERHCASHQRLACGHLWAQAVFHGVSRDLHRKLDFMRADTELRPSAHVPRAARCRRRRSSTDGTSHHGRHFPSRKARACICPVWNNRRGGADDWTDPGRVDYVQLFLALDFSHQFPGWHNDVGSRPSPYRGSTLSGPPQKCRRQARLHRNWVPGTRRRRPAGSSGQGTGGRLVRFAFHTHSGDCVECLPGLAGDLGVVQQEPDYRGPALQEFQLLEFEPDDVHLGHHAVQQPGHDAPVSPDAAGIYGSAGGTGALWGRPRHPDLHADCRPTHRQDAGALHYCFWLAVPGGRHVPLHPAH